MTRHKNFIVTANERERCVEYRARFNKHWDANSYDIITAPIKMYDLHYNDSDQYAIYYKRHSIESYTYLGYYNEML